MSSFPDSTVALVAELEAQVNNGGFDQFFFNSSGDKTEETITALEQIGALKTAELLRHTAAKFPSGSPPREQGARQVELLEISPEGEAFEENDQAFYRYEDALDALMKAYSASG